MPQQSSDVQDIDIAIVGAGIVGLSFALSLVKAVEQADCIKLRIALIDPQNEVDQLSLMSSNDPFSSRVSALTVASEKMLEALGVWESISKIRACPYDEMFVWDTDGTGSISFSAADIQKSRLGNIVENQLVCAALNEALRAREDIEFIQGDSVESFGNGNEEDEEGQHILELKSGHSLKCRMIVAADGSSSFIRKAANFKTKEWDYEHQALVTTVKAQKSHGFRATQCFLPTGPLAFLPLMNPESADRGEQYYSSIVWSCVPEKSAELMDLSDKAFMQVLGKANEFALGNIEQVEKRAAFPLWQKHATDYVQPGIALIGDAAHTIHPLAGQGVNLGLLDVAVLTQVIAEALINNENYASHQILSRYQRQRKGNNLGMMLVMEGFKRLFASNDLSVRWLRNLGISGVDSTPLVKKHLMKKAMGL